jgi:hypothetical protein
VLVSTNHENNAAAISIFYPFMPIFVFVFSAGKKYHAAMSSLPAKETAHGTANANAAETVPQTVRVIRDVIIGSIKPRVVPFKPALARNKWIYLLK